MKKMNLLMLFGVVMIVSMPQGLLMAANDSKQEAVSNGASTQAGALKELLHQQIATKYPARIHEFHELTGYNKDSEKHPKLGSQKPSDEEHHCPWWALECTD